MYGVGVSTGCIERVGSAGITAAATTCDETARPGFNSRCTLGFLFSFLASQPFVNINVVPTYSTEQSRLVALGLWLWG